MGKMIVPENGLKRSKEFPPASPFPIVLPRLGTVEKQCLRELLNGEP
jgi:hypothetical protein